jgi:hypothetical protein
MYISPINACIGLTAAGYCCVKFYPAKCRRAVINAAMLYCRLEVNINSAYKYLYKKIEKYYKYDIFYYKDNIKVGQNTLINLVRNSTEDSLFFHDNSIPNGSLYNYVLYKNPTECRCRIFDSQKELLETFYNNGTIKCQPSDTTIVSACMVTKDEDDNSFSKDVTPRHLGVEIVRNKLYTERFIKHFFELEVPMSYTIHIIDSNINQFTLVNNLTQKQYIEITSTGFNIITENLTETTEDNFFVIRPRKEQTL